MSVQRPMSPLRPRQAGVFALVGVMLVSSLTASGAAPVVKPINAAGVKREVAKRKGKVVLVNVWATWCAPCVASYPALVQLSRKYKPQGLEVISVSIDDNAKLKSGVIPFLIKRNPNFATFIKTPGGDEAFIRAMDPKWYGDVPADFLYGPDGRRVAAFTGETDMKKIEAAVKAQLARVKR